MNKKGFSRRDFLRTVSGLGIATVLGKLLKFFPEVDLVLAKSGSSTGTSLPPIPDDLIVKPIKGKKASEFISQAMESADGLALRDTCLRFSPYQMKPG